MKKAEFKIITPETALEMLKINKRNRPMRQRVVLDYARQMQSGIWKENGEAIIISDGNMLLDGQHRLAAIVKSGVTQKVLVVSGIDSDTFDTIDTGVNRTASDILAIAEVKNYAFMSSAITKYFTIKNNSSIVTTTELRSSGKSKLEVLIEYNTSPELYYDAYKFAKKCERKIRLLQASLIAAYVVYLIKDKKHIESKVFSFFEQLFFDTNIENNVIPALRSKLLLSATSQYKMTSILQGALIAKAWNCYITGKELKVLNINIEKEVAPELI